MSDTFKGEEQILYLVFDGLDYPIGCLTDNGISDSSETIETTTADNEGWTTERPTNQSYSINFSGLEIQTDNEVIEKYSYDLLVQLKRNRTLINWKTLISTDTVYMEQTGQGYITEIGEAASVGDFITFDGTIKGYHKPNIVSNSGTTNNLVFEDGNNYIFEDGNNAVVLI
jgi:hypothetical protein